MPCCFDCQFFHPESGHVLDGRSDDRARLGECRCKPPEVGDIINPGADDEERWFGEYPKVLASDWCGDFAARRIESEFSNTFLADPSVACDVDSLDDARAVNVESTPHNATWASWAAHAAAAWNYDENRNVLHV